MITQLIRYLFRINSNDCHATEFSCCNAFNHGQISLSKGLAAGQPTVQLSQADTSESAGNKEKRKTQTTWVGYNHTLVPIGSVVVPAFPLQYHWKYVIFITAHIWVYMLSSVIIPTVQWNDGAGIHMHVEKPYIITSQVPRWLSKVQPWCPEWMRRASQVDRVNFHHIHRDV